MKDRRRCRGGGLLFSLGCLSQPAVSDEKQIDAAASTATAPDAAAATTEDKCAAVAAATTEYKCAGGGGGEETEEKGAGGTIVQRLIKSLRQMLAAAYDGGEEEEREMVIGYPTDVVHVGHIGWNDVGGMGMVNAFSLPSLRHLEIAMAAAAHP